MGKHDKLGIKSSMHAVLYGPDGKIKDERKPENLQTKEVKDGEKSEPTN